MNARSDSETTLRLTHEFRAPRERVFDAFLDGPVLQRIWSSDEYKIVDMELVPEVGRGWRMAMRDEATGTVLHCGARFAEIVRPSRIVWLTKWEDGPMQDLREMRVTLEFAQTSTGSRVSLTHEFFPDRTTRDHHGQGWGQGFANLARLLEASK